MKQRTKETIASMLLFGAGGFLAHEVLHRPKRGEMKAMKIGSWVAGAALGAYVVQSHKSARYGFDGMPRSLHPDHPLHPYKNGTPAVWGGREILY